MWSLDGPSSEGERISRRATIRGLVACAGERLGEGVQEDRQILHGRLGHLRNLTDKQRETLVRLRRQAPDRIVLRLRIGGTQSLDSLPQLLCRSSRLWILGSSKGTQKRNQADRRPSLPAHRSQRKRSERGMPVHSCGGGAAVGVRPV
jgi:hypothetical protein